MSGHTPGPWEVEWDEEDGSLSIIMASARNGAYCYEDIHRIQYACDCWPEYEDGNDDNINPQYEEAKANAHLISAAPELLEACRVALQQLCVPQHERRDWETIPQIKAAIAKAEAEVTP